MPQAVLNVYGAYPSQKGITPNNVKEGFIVKKDVHLMQHEVESALF
jgi:hypothetical protein